MIVVAGGCFGQSNVDVEYMANLLVLLGAVAFHFRVNALGGQVVAHGLCVCAQKIVAGGGDVGGREVAADGVQHIEPGIFGWNFRAQIVLCEAFPGEGGHAGYIVHAAVQSHGEEADIRYTERKQFCKFRIRPDGGIVAGELGSGGIAHKEHPAGVDVIVFRVFADEGKQGVGVFQRSWESGFGCQTVVEIHHGEALLGKPHAVPAVDLLGAVDIAAAVDADDGGKGSGGVFGVVDVRPAPLAVGAVGDVQMADHALGQWNGGITLAVGAAGGESKGKRK